MRAGDELLRRLSELMCAVSRESRSRLSSRPVQLQLRRQGGDRGVQQPSSSSGVQESRSPGVQPSISPSRSRSRSRSCSSSAPSTAYSVVPGTRTNRTDVPKQGAWTCEECGQLVAKWELYCTNWKCGTRRPLINWREGDWICRACGNHNCRFRRKCEFRDCQGKFKVRVSLKQWDWYCLKCGNHNYARRRFCNTRRCGHPRPE